MKAKFARCLLIFSLVVTVGGHWALLQSAAWLGMLVSYSQSAPFSIALEKTFDGKHPCNLCIFVQEAQESQPMPGALKVEAKIDFWLMQSSSLPLLCPPDPFLNFPRDAGPLRLRAESPPTPPPRLA